MVTALTANKERLQFLGLEYEAETIKNWTEAVTQFTYNSKDILMAAARDYAISLAHIYIGEYYIYYMYYYTCSYHSLLRLLIARGSISKEGVSQYS